MKYNVHLYVGARVLLEGIEANSQAEAITAALAEYDPGAFFHGDDSREGAIPDESILGALVDEEDDPEYKRTQYHPMDDAAVYLKAPDGLPRPPSEAWFSVEVEGDGLTGTWALSEMLDANKDDDHLCAWLRCAAPNEKYQGGGGAAPIFIVERFL